LTVSIDILTRAELVDEERGHIDGWIDRIFQPGRDMIRWSPRNWHVILRVDGELASHLDLVKRTGMAGGQPVIFGGVGDVMTLPTYRGRGYAEQAMRAAQDFMRHPLEADFGLLVCGEALVDWYGKLGWQVMPDKLWFDQPWGKASMPPIPGVTMILPVRRGDFPPGEIDLCGLPW
jgi:GNAT superfamily N-acetyltransferase